MSAWLGTAVAAVTGVLALLALLVIVRSIRRRNLETPASPDLWSGRGYQCPSCGAGMEPGWIMAGRGLIWSRRDAAMPGAFSTISSALPNTISVSLRPACNQSWRCPICSLVLVDHSRLVTPGRGSTGRA